MFSKKKFRCNRLSHQKCFQFKKCQNVVVKNRFIINHVFKQNAFNDKKKLLIHKIENNNTRLNHQKISIYDVVRRLSHNNIY